MPVFYTRTGTAYVPVHTEYEIQPRNAAGPNNSRLGAAEMGVVRAALARVVPVDGHLRCAARAGVAHRRASALLGNLPSYRRVARVRFYFIRVPVRDTGTRYPYEYRTRTALNSYAYGYISRTRTINLIVKFCTPG